MHTRKFMFETNSSSSHSIIVANDGKLKKQPFDDETTNSGEFIIEPRGEYGWEWESYNDTMSKLDYLVIYCRDNPELWEIAQKKILDYSGITVTVDDSEEFGYIDHQSAYGEDSTLAGIIRSDELIDWLFNDNSSIETGNDNI